MTRMQRLPSLGPRGEGWVVAQFLLLGIVVAAGWWTGPDWDDGARAVTSVAGLALIACGGLLAGRGVVDLRDALTPLPHPRDDAELIETGAYRLARHPIYGGLILASAGWGLLTASLESLALTVVLAVFFGLKSAREEAWLADRFPGYAGYRTRTRRFIPWIG